MSKISRNIFERFIHIICILSFICCPFRSIANECSYCNVYQEEIDYESLGEYECMFREFEAIVDSQEDDLDQKTFFLKKWCRKLKRWFKKRLAKVLRKFVSFHKVRNSEECAYEIVQFKKSVDRKLHRTAHIENFIGKFERYTSDPKVSGVHKLSGRIRHYHYNPHARPPAIYAKGNNELDEVPTRALIGAGEIILGLVILDIPFPGCLFVGRTLIGHGATQLYEGYMQKYEREQQINQPPNRELSFDNCY